MATPGLRELWEHLDRTETLAYLDLQDHLEYHRLQPMKLSSTGHRTIHRKPGDMLRDQDTLWPNRDQLDLADQQDPLDNLDHKV